MRDATPIHICLWFMHSKAVIIARIAIGSGNERHLRRLKCCLFEQAELINILGHICLMSSCSAERVRQKGEVLIYEDSING